MATETLEELRRFGAPMLRSGDTAFRVRHSMTTVARGLGLNALSVHFGLDHRQRVARERGDDTVGPLLVGVIAILSNEIRQARHGAGLALPAATFFGALAVGLTASLPGRWLWDWQRRVS